MARPRDPNRDKAFKIYEEHSGDIDLVEIASQLNISPGTVRGWKSKDDWEAKLNGTFQKNTERSKRKGGQPGNKNAVGHGPPEQNKNAVKTGEFETLFFNTLNPEEKELISLIQPDKEQLLLQEIQLLTVREHRMLKRIEDLKQSGDTVEDKVPSGMTVTKFSFGLEKGHPTALRDYQSIFGQIQSVEDAFTRVQARKQRAIESLHKFGYDDARLELETMKFEMELMKQDGTNEEVGDDGFLEAMNHAADVWGDADE